MTDEKTRQLENRIDKLESTIEKMMPSRRDALKMGGAALIGGAAMSGTASAGTNQVGTIGDKDASPPQLVDLHSEDINNADTVTTDTLNAQGIDAVSVKTDSVVSYEIAPAPNTQVQLDPDEQVPNAIFIIGGTAFPGRGGIFNTAQDGEPFDLGSAKDIGTASGQKEYNIFVDSGTTVFENNGSFGIAFEVLKIGF